MSLPRVYVDSSVLILASQAREDDVSQRALTELDRDVEFLFSSIVKLETLPAPTRNGFADQVEFFNQFFTQATEVACDAQVQQNAIAQACNGVGLAAADALHVACAIAGNAVELLTAEGETKQLPQAVGIPVRTIRY